MSDARLSYHHNGGGLNNQKLALLGLFLAGAREKTSVIAPFLYNLDHAGGNSGIVPFTEIFETAPILDFARLHGFEIDFDASPLEGEEMSWQFFAQGAGYIASIVADKRLAPDAVGCDVLRSLVPRVRSHPQIVALREQVRKTSPSTVIQMRIESDWQKFSAITLGPTVGDEEDYLPNFSTIVAKFANTFPGRPGPVYVVCDEAALPVPKEEIRRISRDTFGVDLIWKSDYLTEEFLSPLSVLERSIVDFDIAVAADQFVGMTRSSFSNLVTFERYCQTRADVRDHYIYNIPGPYLVERRDNGAFAFARPAVELPA